MTRYITTEVDSAASVELEDTKLPPTDFPQAVQKFNREPQPTSEVYQPQKSFEKAPLRKESRTSFLRTPDIDSVREPVIRFALWGFAWVLIRSTLEGFGQAAWLEPKALLIPAILALLMLSAKCRQSARAWRHFAYCFTAFCLTEWF